MSISPLRIDLALKNVERRKFTEADVYALALAVQTLRKDLKNSGIRAEAAQKRADAADAAKAEAIKLINADRRKLTTNLVKLSKRLDTMSVNLSGLSNEVKDL